MDLVDRGRGDIDGGLIADFSIQGSGAQKTVWSEGFDAGMPAWEFNYGEGNAITFTLEQSPENYQFSAIDENDVQSLHIDGPYQTFKRTIGTATTPAMNVPANGQFHCYLLCNKVTVSSGLPARHAGPGRSDGRSIRGETWMPSNVFQILRRA